MKSLLKSKPIKDTQPLHKIGIYIRVSTEEQASNPEGSIKSQEQRLRAHVDLKNYERPFGEVSKVFVDRAKSGKDTNRSELQRLLKAIISREITLVMVTELSRLSRSIKDFSDMWELMREHRCEFLSLREQFDTTSAAGEMVMYTIANIAQFERRQTSERISANFQARAERGLFNGGSVPLGYRLDPDKKGYLVVVEEEAVIVRDMFKTFLEEGVVSAAGKKLNSKKYPIPKKRAAGGSSPRLGYFTVGNMYRLLTNPTFIGVRTFSVNGVEQNSKACWDPIIDEDTFHKAQALLKKNHRCNKTAMNSRFPFLLSGLVACGTCGGRMPGKSAHGRKLKIPYYAHGWTAVRAELNDDAKHQCTGPVRVLANIIEPLVWEKVVGLLSDPLRAKRIVDEAKRLHGQIDREQDLDRLTSKITQIDSQTEALAEHLAGIPKGVSPTPIFNQLKKLEETKDMLRAELGQIERSLDDRTMPVDLAGYEEFLAALKRGLNTVGEGAKADIIKKVVSKVEVHLDSATIYYRVSKGETLPLEVAPLGEPKATSQFPAPGKGRNEETPTFFKNRGSTTCLFGGPACHQFELFQK
jgi:DNA invertase Pin-like site-specific DNA recombinase